MIKINKLNIILLTLALVASSFGFSANAQSAPSLSGESANVTGSHNAVLSVFVNPNGSTTELHFKYWTGSDFKERIYLGATGTSSVRINVGLINLLEGTTYSYQIVADNSYGTTTGNTGTFTTPGSNSSSSGNNTSSGSNNTSNNNTSNSSNTAQGAPLVATNGPVSVSANAAVVNGSVNPNNANTTFWFRFGTTQALDQTTTTQSLGGGNSWQLVTGNLSSLEPGKIYYYRVVAQNNHGITSGDIFNFTTGNQVGQTNQNGGQVLGAVSGNGSNAGASTGSGSTSSSSGNTTSSKIAGPSRPKVNERPSFISMEYSIGNNGALVLVADNIKPKPGEELSYTIVYKNDSQYPFDEANLKVITPVEVDYLSSNIKPVRLSGSVVEFNLGRIAPKDQGAVVVTVKIKEDVKTGTSMIFTSVLGYKDRFGAQLATTSYMTVKAGQGGSAGLSLSAFSLGSLSSSTGVLVLAAVGLVVLMGLLTYKFVKIRNGKNGNKKIKKEDIFGMPKVPPTFERVVPPKVQPVSPEVPMGKPDIFQPVR